MNNDAGGWLWLFIDVILTVLLLGGLIYGTIQWRLRSRNSDVQQVRNDLTAHNYRTAPTRKGAGNTAGSATIVAAAVIVVAVIALGLYAHFADRNMQQAAVSSGTTTDRIDRNANPNR